MTPGEFKKWKNNYRNYTGTITAFLKDRYRETQTLVWRNYSTKQTTPNLEPLWLREVVNHHIADRACANAIAALEGMPKAKVSKLGKCVVCSQCLTEPRLSTSGGHVPSTYAAYKPGAAAF